MLADKHDERLFRHYAKIGDDGTVLAVVEIAAGSVQPSTDSGEFAEVTEIHPYDSARLKHFVEASPVDAIKRRVQVGKQRG